jgi:ABC-type branched-subunit amino acid transport system ATPase component/sugar phosphate permease
VADAGPVGAPPATAPSFGALAGTVLDEEARRKSEEALRQPSELVVTDELLAGVGAEHVAFRQVVRTGGASMVVVLTAIMLVEAMDGSAFAVLGPDIQRTLGLSDVALGLVGALSGITVFLASIPLGYLADRCRRTPIVVVSTLFWAVVTVCTGMVSAVWQLVGTRTAAGVGKATDGPVHAALLTDAYPIEGRNRIYAIHRAAQPLGGLVGPVFAGTVAALVGGGEGWRWVFVALAVPAVVLGIGALRLREPGRGHHEMRSVLGHELEPEADELPVPVGAAFARLKKIDTYYFLLCALGALGIAFVSAPIYTNLVLQNTYGLDAAGRGVVGTLSALGALVGALVGGTAGDRLFRRAPERSVLTTGACVAGYGLVFPVAVFMPNIVLYTVLAGVALGLVSAAFVPISGVVAAVTPYRLRSMGFAMVGLYLSLFGGMGGAILLGLLTDSVGERAAIAIVIPPVALVGGGLIAYGSRFVRRDMARAGAELVEEQEERARMAAGADRPLLQVRHLDFSYGTQQVLFDVDLDVEEGEVLALLGTNGAGKSTLLRAISGLEHADRGVVRLDGRTITFADPRTRVQLGIVQVMGGKGVFPALSVEDNLRAGAHLLAGDSRAAAAIEGVLEVFPVLRSRLDQPAGTLSGGEQQLVALASALLLEPRVLLIDELTLGLAPIMVEDLLHTVARLKEQGLTIVIVEQSINVALSIADRAVFMEKGRVRFHGPAEELRERDDLVRAVFLGTEDQP